MERFAKAHDLTTVDTITIIDYDTIPEVRIDTFVVVNDDVSGVDSILGSFKDKLDSVTHIQLGDEIKYYITNRKAIEDTINYWTKEDSIHVQIWESDRGIEFSVLKTKEIVPEVHTVVKERTVVRNKDPTYWWIIWVLGLVILVEIISKRLSRNK